MNTASYATLAGALADIFRDTERDVLSAIIRPDFVLPAQWSEAFRRRHWSREAALLAQVLTSAWEDLDSPDRALRRDARYFFEQADAGEPLSLRFLCEAFGLELSAVQQTARERIQRTRLHSERRADTGRIDVRTRAVASRKSSSRLDADGRASGVIDRAAGISTRYGRRE